MEEGVGGERGGERERNWVEKTGSFFDPFDACAQNAFKEVECPRCRRRMSVRESSPQ